MLGRSNLKQTNAAKAPVGEQKDIAELERLFDGDPTRPTVQEIMFTTLDDIPNKKSFEHDLAAQMDAGRVVSLFFVDLDGFKEMNDNHGHPEGDKCLMQARRCNVEGR
jgi:GGDEF domain-containing protein